MLVAARRDGNSQRSKSYEMKLSPSSGDFPLVTGLYYAVATDRYYYLQSVKACRSCSVSEQTNTGPIIRLRVFAYVNILFPGDMVILR